MLEELARDILIGGIVMGELNRDLEKIERIHGHPARAVRLLNDAAARQRLVAVKDSNVIEAQKPALENVVAFGILAVHPPGEIQKQLLKYALKKKQVGLATR